MRTYLDHASTSPLRPAAVEALEQFLSGSYGDPGRIHSEGMSTRVAVESAREQVAALLGSRPREIVFTSGATESITMATFGAVTKTPDRRHIVLSRVEHSAVRESSERQWTTGSDTTYVEVDGNGVVDPDAMIESIRPDTALVHIQWVNHEVGSIQPVEVVVAHCRDVGVLVHVDASQAVGKLPVDFRALGADLMSVSGHKFGGPPGTGVLVVRRGVRLPPLMLGGDQERARRAGMENTLGVIALGAAAEDATANWPEESARCAAITTVIRDWAETTEGVTAYGAVTNVAPHIVCLGIDGLEPQPVLLGLDQRGVAAHSGSSCSSESLEPSPVLEAMGVDAQRSLRISSGWNSSPADADKLLTALESVLVDLEELRGSAPR